MFMGLIEGVPRRNPVRCAINRETESLRYLRQKRGEVMHRVERKTYAVKHGYDLELIDRAIGRSERKRIYLLTLLGERNE